MSALEFVISGGMASVGGEIPDAERKQPNEALKIFGNTVREIARQYQIPASNLTVFRSTFLLIGRDASEYHFVFAEKPGENHLVYRDFKQHGRLSIESLAHQVRIEIGEVPWAFSVPLGLVAGTGKPLEDRVKAIAAAYIESLLQAQSQNSQVREEAIRVPELAPYVSKFRKDFPPGVKTAFIMMQFSTTPAHGKIVAEIKRVLGKHGITALRADDKEYAEDLFTNVRVYLHCCDFGVAVFERLISNDINPNVSLEVGYLFGLNKQVCLLKDQTLQQLNTDLVGKIYKPFDPQAIESTIEGQLEKWLRDKGLI